MATIAEQLTSLANTKTAIKDAIVAKGVAVADNTPFSGYAAKIGEIQGGGGAPATKFGASVDSFIGDVDADGVLQHPTGTLHLDFSGVKTIGLYALYNLLATSRTISQNFSEITADFSSVELIGQGGMEEAFENTNLTQANIQNLKTISFSGLRNAFKSTKIQNISLQNLQTIQSNALSGVCQDCTELAGIIDLGSLVEAAGTSMQDSFNGCGKITGYIFDSLQTLGNLAWNRIFKDNTSLTVLRFPSLISVATNSFGSTTSNSAFVGCTALTEIHFRADMQATIEAMTGYADKWGATNATIYYDL